MAKISEVDHSIGSLVHAMAGPVIVFPNTGWEETIPKWIFEEIRLRRLMRCMQENRNKVPAGEENQALNIEALAYMYPATLYAPLDHDWTQIYCWLTRKCMMERMVGGKPMTEQDFHDVAPKDLTKDEARQLHHLKFWLWEKNQEQRKRLSRRDGPREPVVQIAAPEQLFFPFVKEMPLETVREPEVVGGHSSPQPDPVRPVRRQRSRSATHAGR